MHTPPKSSKSLSSLGSTKGHFGRELTSCFSKTLERDGRPMLRGCRYTNPRPNSSSCSSSTFCTPSRPMSRSPESPSKYQRGVTYLSSKPSVSVSIPDGHHHSTTAASSGFLVSSCVFVKTSSHTNHLQPQNMQAEHKD